MLGIASPLPTVHLTSSTMPASTERFHPHSIQLSLNQAYDSWKSLSERLLRFDIGRIKVVTEEQKKLTQQFMMMSLLVEWPLTDINNLELSITFRKDRPENTFTTHGKPHIHSFVNEIRTMKNRMATQATTATTTRKNVGSNDNNEKRQIKLESFTKLLGGLVDILPKRKLIVIIRLCVYQKNGEK